MPVPLLAVHGYSLYVSPSSTSASVAISCSSSNISACSLLYLGFLELCSGCSISRSSFSRSCLRLLKSSSSFFSLREISVSVSRPVILFSSLFRRFSSRSPSRLIFWTVLSLALYSCSCNFDHPLYCFVPVILSYPDSPPISPTLHLPSLQWNPSACLSFAHLKFPLQPDKM